MLITELRITMPMTPEEYQVGMLYGVAQASLNETGGGEGVEVLKNEPYKDVPLLNGKYCEGQFTHKIYHLESKVPSIIRYIAPTGSLKLKEEAWNAHPNYCKTVITNPGYMKDNFFIKLETACKPDRGESENVHELSPEQLAIREVVHMNIGDTNTRPTGSEDPSTYTCTKTEPPRGPLTGDWNKTCTPVMTVYKLITLEFKWFGLQTKVESFLMSYEQTLFNKFHRQIYCWMNDWAGMTLEDIRALEDKTTKDLEDQRTKGEKRGTFGEE